MKGVILAVLAGLLLACGGATEPEEVPYYVGDYQAVSVNGFDVADLDIVFTVNFNPNLTADLRFAIPSRGIDRPATGTYDEPDGARDSELRLDEPYTDVYQVHWSGDNPASQVTLVAGDIWQFERIR